MIDLKRKRIARGVKAISSVDDRGAIFRYNYNGNSSIATHARRCCDACPMIFAIRSDVPGHFGTLFEAYRLQPLNDAAKDLIKELNLFIKNNDE